MARFDFENLSEAFQAGVELGGPRGAAYLLQGWVDMQYPATLEQAPDDSTDTTLGQSA